MAVEGDSVVNIVAAIYVGTLVALIIAALSIHKMFGKTLSTLDKLILCWSSFDAVGHLLMDVPYLVSYFVEGPGALMKSDHSGYYAQICQYYGKLDRRMLTNDPTLIGAVMVTDIIMVPLEILLCLSIVKGKSNRHFLQTVTAMTSLAMVWMYAVPEILKGNKSDIDLRVSPMDSAFLIIFGALYVILDLVMLCQSCCGISGCEKPNPTKSQKTKDAPQHQTVRRSNRIKKKAE